MNNDPRAMRHAALGDERRLSIVDHLALGDLTVSELADLVQMEGNLLAHHLEVLERAGLIDRRVSEGDHRRRYVSLCWESLPAPISSPLPSGEVAFICTNNAARSQFAAALWRDRSGSTAWSAGARPATRVHPKAVKAAADFGVDLSREVPAGYENLPGSMDLIISVCDRARESGVPDAARQQHWSIADPVPAGTLDAFRSAFEEIASRIERLVKSEILGQRPTSVPTT